MNVKEIYFHLKKALSSVSDCPGFEAEQLLSRFCGVKREKILAGIGDACEETLRLPLERRLSGEPLQYILGEWDFYGRTFTVGEGVLIPRADTEILVEAALEAAKAFSAPRILDLCAGSGCIAVTMALERPDAVVTALEKSPKALAFLRENAALHRASVRITEGDVLAPEGSERYDLILSNPPYLTGGEMDALQREVRHEPAEALFGGEDGLRFYRAIAGLWRERFLPGGRLLVEIGRGQERAVTEILQENNFTDICFHRDLCGIIRVLEAAAPVTSTPAGNH